MSVVVFNKSPVKNRYKIYSEISKKNETPKNFIFYGSGIQNSAFIAAFARSFGLLLSPYGRLFITFLFAEVAEDVVFLALSLKTLKSAFQRFVFTDSYYGH